MMSRQVARWGSKIPRQKSIASAGLIALLWLYLHPLSSDQISLVALSLPLGALLISSFRIMNVTLLLRKNLRIFVILSVVVVMATLTSLIGSPELEVLREVLVVCLVLLLGIVVGKVSGIHATLSGVLVGATSVALIGWFLSLDSLDRLGFDPFSGGSDFKGITGHQMYEFFSALVGVAVGFEILSRSTRLPAVVVSLITFSAVTLVWTGSITGWVSLAAVLLTASFRAFFRGKYARFALPALSIAIAAGVAAAITLAVNQSLASAIIGALGKSNSLNRRFLSWEAALQAIEPVGLWFGHGVSFWRAGSAGHDQVAAVMATHNWGPVGHAHNAHVDLLIAFGIVGLALIATALFYLFRGQRAHGSSPGALPWVLFVALAVQGLADVMLVSRPLGWLLTGLLVGAFSTSLADRGARNDKNSQPDTAALAPADSS